MPKSFLALALVFILLASTIHPVSASPYTPHYDAGKMISGIRAVSYYIDDSLLNGGNYYYVTNNIASAFEEWANATRYNSNENARVGYYRTSNRNSANIIFTLNTYYPDPHVIYYTYSTSGTPQNQPGGEPTGNWATCIVYLNDGNRRTILHELGHCFGLDHPWNPYQSIMYPTNDTNTNKRDYVTTSDASHLNDRYQ